LSYRPTEAAFVDGEGAPALADDHAHTGPRRKRGVGEC